MASYPIQSIKSDIKFGINMPPPDKGGNKETLLVNQKQLEQFASSLREQQEKEVKLEEVMTKWKTAVMKEVGESNWKKVIAFSSEQRRSNYGLAEITHNPDGLAELNEAKRAAREESLKLLKEIGLEPGSLKPLNRKYFEKIDDLLEPELPDGERLVMITESDLPEEIIAGKSNPWTIKKPPYDGWAWSHGWSRTGGSDPDLFNYVNSASGGVGHRSTYRNLDAGDYDSFWLNYQTNIGVWYWPPHAGFVDLYIKARCVNASYNVWLDDEWGWSDSDIKMNSYVTVNVSPVATDQDKIKTWSSHSWGSPDNTYASGQVIKSNEVRWFHMVSSDVVPANAWTYVKVGTHDVHRITLNDVSTNSTMRNWWFFEELWMDVH